jgi:conjugal transfer mating pair stabilization protein TraN
VCSQGAETRTINGSQVYKDCWQYQDTYSCVDPANVNYCQPLEAAGCSQTNSTCVETAFNGACMRFKNTYQCNSALLPLPSTIEQLASTYAILKDEVVTSACAALQNSSVCEQLSETCTEGAATRNINGLDIYKACWKWERKYSCASTNLQSDCQDLLADSKCNETGSSCVERNTDGSCSNVERQFKCKIKDGSSTPVTSCNGQTFCGNNTQGNSNGQCFDIGHEPDADFARASTGMEVIREGGTYFDPATLKLFSGRGESCKKTFGSLGNCCKSNPNAGSSNRNASEAAGIVLKVAGESVRAGSAYAFDALFNGPGNNFITQGVQSMFGSSASMGNAANPFGAAQFSSNFSFYGASFSMGPGGFQFVSFDPYSFAAQIALQVVLQLISCEQTDKVLAMKRGNNLCEYVGSWCSKKALNVCIQRREGYCCFNSKLAKIINVQGKQQLNRSYGNAETPDCSGFTANEMENLDFSKMNLEEFYGDLIKSMPDLAARTAKNTGLIQQRVDNYFQNGTQTPRPRP